MPQQIERNVRHTRSTPQRLEPLPEARGLGHVASLLRQHQRGGLNEKQWRVAIMVARASAHLVTHAVVDHPPDGSARAAESDEERAAAARLLAGAERESDPALVGLARLLKDGTLTSEQWALAVGAR